MLAQTLILSSMAVLFAPVPKAAVKVPESPAPTFLHVSGVDAVKNHVHLEHVVQVPVNEIRQEVVIENGVKKIVTKTVVRSMNRRFTMVRSLADFRITNADGKEFPRAEAIKRLNGGTMVVFTTDENGVDPLYRKLLAKGTVILVNVSPQPKK